MLQRSVMGVRVGFTLVAVLCYFGTLTLLASFPALDQGQAFDALEWLVMAIGVAIVGDTVRPSGKSVSAFSGAQPPAGG